MKKLIMLVVVALACMGGGGVLASTASASNCSPVQGQTYWNAGLWHFQVQLQGCTGVDQAQISRTAPSGCGPCLNGSGWVDFTAGQIYHRAQSAYNVEEYLFGRPGVNMVNSGVGVWNIPPWCAAYGYPPGSAFVAYTYFSWRIHATGGQWGPWHTTTSGNYNIGC